jgi:hypothetical protein
LAFTSADISREKNLQLQTFGDMGMAIYKLDPEDQYLLVYMKDIQLMDRSEKKRAVQAQVCSVNPDETAKVYDCKWVPASYVLNQISIEGHVK